MCRRVTANPFDLTTSNSTATKTEPMIEDKDRVVMIFNAIAIQGGEMNARVH